MSDDELDNPAVGGRDLYENLLAQHIEKKIEAAIRSSMGRQHPVEPAQEDHHRITVRGDIVAVFDPDNNSTTADGWLQKIDQLGDVHGWTDYEKSSYMQMKLRGTAKDWFDRLTSYDKTWQEWKAALVLAFPRHTDYATVLEELVQRKKRSDETMTHYYHAKLAFIQQCRLDDMAAISCIINGLPLELQPNARAYQCDHPDQLYANFISPLENYRSPMEPPAKRYRHETKGASTSRQPARKSGSVECFRCGKMGHYARDCRQNAEGYRLKCFKCNQYGHKRDQCTSGKGNQKEVKLIQSEAYNKVYEKDCIVNGVAAKGYVDTGSQVNVISAAFVARNQLLVRPASTFLRGFGGAVISISSEADLFVNIDGLEMHSTAVVTKADMSAYDFIIGQPIINADNVALRIEKGKCFLGENLLEMFRSLSVGEDECRKERPVFRLIKDVSLTPHTMTFVEVQVAGVSEGVDVFMDSQRYQLGKSIIHVPAMVCPSPIAKLPVFNVGPDTVLWEANKLIGRGERCDTLVIPPKVEVSFTRDCANVGRIEIEKVIVGSSLADTDKRKLFGILQKWSHCFVENMNELGTVAGCELDIKLEDESKTVCYRPYRLSFEERNVVRSKVNELLEAGVIRESNSRFASPIVLVKKKNGEYRMCVDFRALNKMTVRDVYPMSNIEEQLNSLSGQVYFTSLDCSNGFHQIKVNEKSVPKTAFITPDGHFEYLKMPFGLVNAPAVFQRALNLALGKLRFERVLVYMDDLLLPSSSIEEGLELIETVIRVLDEANFKLNLKKCSFLMSSIQYLGHEISLDGISPGEVKTAAVINFKTPTSVHEVRQFLGLAGYFRKFVQNFAIIAAPIIKLTKKNVPFEWGETQTGAFNELKQHLANKPILMPFNHRFKSQVHTDASSKGIAGILLQEQADKHLKPVAYFSRVTSPAEQVYHSYELETLAVVETLQRFRIYLIGSHFTIVTDCSAVRYTFSKKDLIPRIARWWLRVQEFDFEIEHRPSDSMKHVDALSRNPQVMLLTQEDWFLSVQLQDDLIHQIVEQLNNNTNPDLDRDYVYKNSRLYRKTTNGEKLVIPRGARFQLLHKYHDEIGHPGLARCSQLIKDNYWFPKMTRFIVKYVKSCLRCAYKKGHYGKFEGELHPIPKPDVPMHTVHIDHIGPYVKSKSGYSYVLTMVDSFTKFMIAKPSRTLGSAECIKILHEVFCGFLGYPKRIISDNGLAFSSRHFAEFVSERQIKHVLTAVATPRANGQVERFHRTLLDAMRTSGDDNDLYWDTRVPDIIWGINNTVNSSTKYTPHELLFGYKGNLLNNLESRQPTENLRVKRTRAQDNLKNVARKMKERYDRKRKRATKYKRGDLVLWKGGNSCNITGVNKKLDGKFTGPYVVEKLFEGDRYRIRSVKGMRGYKNFSTLVAVDALRPFKSMQGGGETDESDDEQVQTREDLIDLLES